MSGRKILIIWGTFAGLLFAGHFVMSTWGFWAANLMYLAVAVCAAVIAWLSR